MSVERNWKIGFGAVNMTVLHLPLRYGWNSLIQYLMLRTVEIYQNIEERHVLVI